MAERGGQPGNQNAAKGKRWQEAILRALARAGKTVDGGLDQAAAKLVQQALRGDKWAIDHIADRLDGKPQQGVDMTMGGETNITVRGV